MTNVHPPAAADNSDPIELHSTLIPDSGGTCPRCAAPALIWEHEVIHVATNARDPRWRTRACSKKPKCAWQEKLH